MANRRQAGAAVQKINPKGSRLATVGPKGGITYAQEFVEAVVRYAFRHTQQEAADFFDLPRGTVHKWCSKYRRLNTQAERRKTSVDNPYRESSYGIDRRLKLSDKLFAEVEHTLEISKLRNKGAVPADVLQKLVTSYGALVDKRRLEEGAHTALVQAVKDPEEIYQEGEAQVVEFRKRHALPSGS